MKMETKRIVKLVKPFQIQTDSEKLILAILRAEYGFDNATRESIMAKTENRVCAYCRERHGEYADHTIPIVWFRLADLCGINLTDESNGNPICIPCNNAKQKREDRMAARISRALSRNHGKYVRALVREFQKKERALVRKFARWQSSRVARGESSRDSHNDAARVVRFLFVAFGVPRRGRGNSEWWNKIANLNDAQIRAGFARLTRLDIPQDAREEIATIWTASQSVLSIFRAMLESVMLLRRARDKVSLANVKACLQARRAFFSYLAQHKIPLANWQEKARGNVAQECDKLFVAYSEMRDSYMQKSRWYDAQ